MGQTRAFLPRCAGGLRWAGRERTGGDWWPRAVGRTRLRWAVKRVDRIVRPVERASDANSYAKLEWAGSN
jgi:hypothetical protein